MLQAVQKLCDTFGLEFMEVCYFQIIIIMTMEGFYYYSFMCMVP